MLKMKTALRFHLCWLIFCWPALASEANSLAMGVDRYPPLQVILPNGKVTGENVVVTRALADRLGLTLSFTGDIPSNRCLQWLKEGSVDIMTGLLDSGEQRKHSHLAKGRVDAVRCTRNYGEFIVNQHPQYQQNLPMAQYSVSAVTPVYVGLSKNSRFTKRADDIARTAASMLEDGTFTRLIMEFQQRFPQYYP
ncbi:hypothetical protein GCM10027098_33610 [Bowmanella dokdonensis]